MPKQEILKAKVCLVGEAAVGKTSLIRRYVLDEFDDKYIISVSAKVTKKDLEMPMRSGGPPVALELAIWDIMGHPRFRDLLVDSYFEGVSGILAVADVTRRETLDALFGWIERIDAVSSLAPVVVAVNKSDLEGAAEFTEADVAPIVRAFRGACLATSAKTGAGVEEAFRLLGARIVERVLAEQ